MEFFDCSTCLRTSHFFRTLSKTPYEEALSRGDVQVLRLASLDSNGDIQVKSTDIEINDETFHNVGICSYTWGLDRVTWYDEETGLSWEVADRCEDMCRAALKFYPQVWIDGLCMIQKWPAHIQDNMSIMGRLYWHVGRIIVAYHSCSCIDSLCWRSFTNMIFVLIAYLISLLGKCNS